MVSAPVLVTAMPQAATSVLRAANVAALVVLDGMPPCAHLPGSAAMDPDLFFVRASLVSSRSSGVPGLEQGSSPSQASYESNDRSAP